MITRCFINGWMKCLNSCYRTLPVLKPDKLYINNMYIRFYNKRIISWHFLRGIKTSAGENAAVKYLQTV